MNKQDNMTPNINNKNDPQKKHRLGVCCMRQALYFHVFDEHLTKHWISAKEKNSHKIPNPLNPKVLESICNIF